MNHFQQTTPANNNHPSFSNISCDSPRDSRHQIKYQIYRQPMAFLVFIKVWLSHIHICLYFPSPPYFCPLQKSFQCVVVILTSVLKHYLSRFASEAKAVELSRSGQQNLRMKINFGMNGAWLCSIIVWIWRSFVRFKLKWNDWRCGPIVTI